MQPLKTKVTRKKDQFLIISGSNSLTGAGEAYSGSVLCPRLCRRLWASLKQKVTTKEMGEQERRQEQGTDDRKTGGRERQICLPVTRKLLPPKVDLCTLIPSPGKVVWAEHGWGEQ